MIKKRRLELTCKEGGFNCYFSNISILEMTWTSFDLYLTFINKDVCILLELIINFNVYSNLHFVVGIYCNLVVGIK
jgi:hypothetical protein